LDEYAQVGKSANLESRSEIQEEKKE